MTAELVLLLSVYAMLIMGLFVSPEYGVVSNFHNNLPFLSARLERNISTGIGFYSSQTGNGYKWKP